MDVDSDSEMPTAGPSMGSKVKRTAKTIEWQSFLRSGKEKNCVSKTLNLLWSQFGSFFFPNKPHLNFKLMRIPIMFPFFCLYIISSWSTSTTEIEIEANIEYLLYYIYHIAGQEEVWGEEVECGGAVGLGHRGGQLRHLQEPHHGPVHRVPGQPGGEQ